MRGAILVLAASALVACTPTTQGDGFYRCSRTSRCPSSAPVCGGDGFCHAAGVDAAASDGGDAGTDGGSCPPIDAGPTPYADCSAPGATCPSGQMCILGDAAPDRAGYCAPRCTCDSDCPEYMGSGSVCGTDGFCRRGCPSSTDTTVCPYPLVCGRGRWNGTAITLACERFESFFPAEIVSACTTDTNCPSPLSCVGGQCLRPCSSIADCIDQVEHCVASAAGPSACLFDCQGDPTVCAPGMTCASNACRPDGW